MEVLNKNQRESALLRLFGLGTVIIVVILVILFAMHKQYAGMGVAELDKLKKEYEAQIQLLIGQKQDEINKNKKLNSQIATLKADINQLKGPQAIRDATLENLRESIEDLNRQLESKDRELEHCRADLRYCQTNSNRSNK